LVVVVVEVVDAPSGSEEGDDDRRRDRGGLRTRGFVNPPPPPPPPPPAKICLVLTDLGVRTTDVRDQVRRGRERNIIIRRKAGRRARRTDDGRAGVRIQSFWLLCTSLTTPPTFGFFSFRELGTGWWTSS